MLTKYPFKSGQELQKCLGSFQINFQVDGMQDSFATAADVLIDIISQPVYDLAIQQYENPPEEGSTNADKYSRLVEMVQYALAQRAVYDHFIWFQLNISDDRITTHKSDKETTLFGYQADEAKESLLKRFGLYTTMLVDFLNSNPTVFPEWANSEQYKELIALPINNYKAFDKLFGIERDAGFYIRCRSLMDEVWNDEIKPITGELTEEIRTDASQMRRINRFLVYRTMELAIYRFDYCFLPGTIRRSIDSELSKKGAPDISYIKEKLSKQIGSKAEEYLLKLDMFKATEGKTAEEIPYKPFESNYSEDDGFVFPN